jgi:crotonobetainyl-CoA:carnitine CoA-transferase CaiB-like acyl-CoA transferase
VSDGALTGLIVLDLSENIAGPYCTKLLADYGADVIKLEKPQTGDASRRAGPFPKDKPDMEKSGLFLFLNTSKKGITLDIENELSRDIFKQLVKQTDIVV